MLVIFDTLIAVLRLVVLGLMMFCFASVFQGKPVEPWLAWSTAVLVVFWMGATVQPSKKE
jgi:hypothetical protein